MLIYDKIKGHKKVELHPLPRRDIFGKTVVGQFDPFRLFRVKTKKGTIITYILLLLTISKFHLFQILNLDFERKVVFKYSIIINLKIN